MSIINPQKHATVGVLMINNVDGHVPALYDFYFFPFPLVLLFLSSQNVPVCHVCCYSNIICFCMGVSACRQGKKVADVDMSASPAVRVGITD